jgi:eukaryotic-like serine/threonine-protein kinase
MIPATLGHYRIESKLGEGGMGEVYLAEDTKLGRKVALKVLAAALTADAERRSRFEREARTIAALNHPNIVTIHSVEEHAGVVFLTMELVDGKPVSEVIPRDGMTIDALLKMAIPLADAVGAAHQRGITHRDLKPANVMVTDDGRVKVLDFGLAKIREDAPLEGYGATVATAQLTGEGRIMGTVAYMSPEQAEGKPVDQRSDIFSLGIVLFELATGRKPFAGDSNVSTLSAILKETPRSVTELRQDLPREFARIVRRCLAKDPEERYQTAKDLRNDLRSLKEDLDTGEVSRDATRSAVTTQTTAVTAPETARRRAATGPVVGALALAGLAGAALVVWWLWGPSRGATPAFASVKLTRLTNTGDAALAAISPDGRYVVHVVGRADKPSLWMRQVSTASNVQIVAPMEGRYDGLSFSPDGEAVLYVFYPKDSNIASLYQIPVLGGTPRKLVDDIDTPPAFSPDGKRMAYIRGLGQQGQAILVATADGTGERRLSLRKPADTYQQTAIAWSPDGRLIAAPIGVGGPRSNARIVLVDVATGIEKVLGSRAFDAMGQLAWALDGSAVLFDAIEQGQGPGANGQVWAMAYPGGDVRRITNDLNNYTSVSASRGGHQLVAVQRELRANLWVAPAGDASAARQLFSTSNGREGVGGIDWTPDGRILYSASTRGSWDLWIANGDGTQARQLTTDPGTEGLPRVSPDGTRVVFMSDRTGEFQVWICDIDGGNQRQLTKEGGLDPTFAPDGSIVFRATDGTSVRAFRIAADGSGQTPLFADTSRLPPQYEFHGLSPDGRLALGHYIDADARGIRTVILPLDGGAALPKLPFTTDGVTWSRDGKAIEDRVVRDGVTNIVRFPLDGSAPTQATAFTSDQIFRHSWSRDGKWLAMARGTESADVVLISSETKAGER